MLTMHCDLDERLSCGHDDRRVFEPWDQELLFQFRFRKIGQELRQLPMCLDCILLDSLDRN